MAGSMGVQQGPQCSNFVAVCDHCDSTISSVFCLTDGVFLCSRCDEFCHSHNRISMRHVRVPYQHCPQWAYREAKSKGRLRDGVPAPPPQPTLTTYTTTDSGGLLLGSFTSSAALTNMGANTGPTTISGTRSATDWVPQPHVEARGQHVGPLCAQGPASAVGLLGPIASAAAGVGNNPQPQVQQQVQPQGLPVVRGARAPGPMNTVWPPSSTPPGQQSMFMPSQSLTAPETSRANSMAGSMDQQASAATGTGSACGLGAHVANNPINQHLASLLEEFKLPDLGGTENLLMEMPPSPLLPPNQPQQNSGTSMDIAMPDACADARAQYANGGNLTGSLKSSNTGLAGSVAALDCDARSPFENSSSTSLCVAPPSPLVQLHQQLHQQHQQQSSSSMHLPKAQPHHIGSFPASQPSLAQHSMSMPMAASDSLASSLPNHIAGSASNISMLGNLLRSNPMPIASSAGNNNNNNNNNNSSMDRQNSNTLVRGMMLPSSGGNNPSALDMMIKQDLSKPAVPILAPPIPMRPGRTPDNSWHGAHSAASVLGSMGLGSMDDAQQHALSMSLLGTSAPASTIASNILASLGAPSSSSYLPGRASSLLIETASAASIEARARALINSSSRTPQAPVFDPTMAMRIERPDGSIRELDPERAAQLHRYRQKRMARLKAFTEGQKKIRYECRKQLADSRPRVRGRFAKIGSHDNLSSLLEGSLGSLGSFSSLGSFGSQDLDVTTRGSNAYAALMQHCRIDEEGMEDQHGGQLQLGAKAPPDTHMRRAMSCSTMPGGTVLSSDNQHSAGRPYNPMAQAAARVSQAGACNNSVATVCTNSTAACSSLPSSGSPCLGSNCATPHDDMVVLGAELEAAIAAANEQECLTVTDQELAALGFGSLVPPPIKSPHSPSEGSAESMSAMAPMPLKQCMGQQPKGPLNDPFGIAMDIGEPCQPHGGPGGCGVRMDNDFADEQVSNMLDELLQDQSLQAFAM